MSRIDEYSALLEIRRKAARRNGVFLGGMFLAVAALMGWLLSSEYEIKWYLLVYGFLLFNLGFLINLQLSAEAFHKGLLDFIKILQQIEE